MTNQTTSKRALRGLAAEASLNKGYRTTIRTASHELIADEPSSLGGTDAGPTPVELLSASLASCTAMTARMYADRKGFDVTSIDVVATPTGPAPGGIPGFELDIKIEGDLTDEQRKRVFEIAGKCPVHQTLHEGADVSMKLIED